MKKFLKILSFEFYSITGKKSWIIPTFIFVALGLAMAFLPQIIRLFGVTSFSLGDGPPGYEPPRAGVVNLAESVQDDTLLSFLPPDSTLYETEAELEAALLGDDINEAYVIHSLDHYTPVQHDTSIMSSRMPTYFDQVMYRLRELAYLGDDVDYAAFRAAVDKPLENTPRILGTDGQSNYAFTYGLIFVIYFLVIFYGSMVSTSVAREKSDRTMELLITSAPPNKLFYGKVFGAGLAGVLQFGLIVLAIFLGFFLNRNAWGFNIFRYFAIPPRVWIIFIAFTLVGYLLYLFIYAMLGSTVSKVEDVSTASTPIMLLIVASFMIVNFTMFNPDSAPMVITSYIPLSSPIAMFARSALGSTVTDWEILLSFGILLVTTILVGIVSAKLYRLGTLNYGNRLKLGQAVKMLREDV